jgi:DeoR/GlpR family transcriptional regulator of sugar metabolism
MVIREKNSITGTGNRMILSEVRDYLKQQHRVTLAEMASHFDMSADALRGILAKWIAKGKLIKVDMGGACGSTCSKCDPALTEIYEWIEN